MKILKNREIKNASWLIIGRVIQMFCSLMVGVLTARFLGPSSYGLIGYAGAYTAFFTSLCNLGLNSIIVKELIDNKDIQGKILGTIIGLRTLSSLLSAMTIVGIVFIVDKGESITVLVVALCSISLVFQAGESINYWFQSRYQSKVTSIAILFAYLIVSSYKVILLILKKEVQWFAFATALDFICLSIFLYVSYKKYGGQKLSFSWTLGKKLLGKSYHYILSGMMVAIYGQTDKMMLKQMLSENEVGYYSVAQSISNMWVFILAAIIDSMYPTIMYLYQEKKEEFDKKNKQLYAVVFYLSLFASLGILILGSFIVKILYGSDYLPATLPLKIITWYTAFSYLGVARNAWIVCENKQKYLKYMYICAAIINIILNLVFIPILGAAGAALASLITQVFTSILLPLMWKDMRKNVKLMIEGILLKGVFIKK